MIIVATDAPLDSRNLNRLAQRALAGMARTGSSFSDGSGDYVVAFSTAPQLRVRASAGPTVGGPVLTNEAASPLFRAVIEASEEAILNSLFKATDVSSRYGSAAAIPINDVVRLVKSELPRSDP
jgi:D-aminopeptidase